ncbi:MAG: YafY family transcriptional regulator [Clostridiales bacterium]|nr:YafY family transcriptional regulator [Clostridiales bacterium]
MQFSVMFGMLMTMLNKKTVSRKYLAEKYEISERTVSRYLDTMCAGGIPIYSIHGPNGGFAISDEYKVDKSYFTPEEIQTIISALGATGSINNDKVSLQIIDKFKGLSTAQKKSSQFVIKNDTFIIDSGSWTNPEQLRNKMDIINKGIFSGITLQIVYIDRYDMKTTRDFDPYAIALKDGTWYTYGWCHSRKDFRLFKMARIKSLKLTANTFERKESNVYEALKGNFDEIDMVDVEFEFTSLIYEDIVEWLGSDSIIERGMQYVAKASLYYGNALISKLLSFGSSIRILSPLSLRNDLLDECQRILRSAVRNGDVKVNQLKIE